jgi:type IV secretory pathway component VirB8
MDDISRTIAQNVKTGQYFKDARNWYTNKYIGPITERSVLVVMMVAASVAASVIIYIFSASFPIRREVPFVIKVQDSLDYYSVIRALGGESIPPQKALAEYLVEDYVTNRESYSSNKLEKQALRVRAASSRQVYKKYDAEISINNPESPVLIYQRMKRRIEIVSIALQGTENEYTSAVVTFKATIDDPRVKEKTVTTHEALINFTLADIQRIIKEKVPLDFIVTNYSVRKLI